MHGACEGTYAVGERGAVAAAPRKPAWAQMPPAGREVRRRQARRPGDPGGFAPPPTTAARVQVLNRHPLIEEEVVEAGQDKLSPTMSNKRKSDHTSGALPTVASLLAAADNSKLDCLDIACHVACCRRSGCKRQHTSARTAELTSRRTAASRSPHCDPTSPHCGPPPSALRLESTALRRWTFRSAARLSRSADLDDPHCGNL